MQSWMIGMVAGIISVGMWPALPPWPCAILFTVLALLPLGSSRWSLRILSGVACGCLLGFLHGTDLLQRRLASECVGIPVTVTGWVGSLPVVSSIRGGTRQRFEFYVSELSPALCAGPATLMLSYYGNQTILPGERWRLEVKLKEPWGLANEASYNIQDWYAQEGIDAVGSVRQSAQQQRQTADNAIRFSHNRLRWVISEHIASLPMVPEVAAILRALTVADRSGIDSQLWQLLQQYGINHLLVISGLHVGLLAGVGYVLGGMLLRLLSGLGLGLGGVWLPPVLALLLAVVYGALAGFSLPVQRALIMLGCFIVATLTGRSRQPASNLLLAATVVLAINPLAAVGSGFWLSFGAVAALLWLARWQAGVRPVWRLLGTHGYMSLVMLPLGALFFGGASLIAMLANLVMIPLVGMVVVPLSLLATLAFLCGWQVESLLWYLAAWPLEQLLPLANKLAELGRQWIFVHLAASFPQVLLGLAAVSLLILPGSRAVKVLAVVLLLPLLLPFSPVVETPSLATSVTVLDVGQGTAVVVRSGNKTMLYDTGGGDPQGMNMGSTVVLPYLRKQGVTELDTLVISHPDLDHSAGTQNILAAMPVKRFRFGGESGRESQGRPCIAGEAWRWPGGQVFQFLAPGRELRGSSNNSSCVLQLEVGGYRLLLPGDIEKTREWDLVNYWGDYLRSEWLLAAHHGSRTSSSPALIKRVQPEVVVISSGYANRFGHPHPLVLQRLRGPDVNIYWTATDGALEFKLMEGAGMRISAYRQVVRRYWL